MHQKFASDDEIRSLDWLSRRKKNFRDLKKTNLTANQMNEFRRLTQILDEQNFDFPLAGC